MTSTQKEIRIDEEEAGGRLDRVLAAHITELSRTRLKTLIEAGSVAIDGRTIRDPGHRVNSAAAITVEVPEAAPAKPAAEAIPLNVVYEDTDIIVIDKPKGLVVHPAAGHWTGTLVNALVAHCGESLSGIGGERRPGIVHRLDKDTTGLMVVAKNDSAHKGLADQFASHGREGGRSSAAIWLSSGAHRTGPRGTIDRPIDRHQDRARSHGDSRRRPGGGDALGGAGALWRPEGRYPPIGRRSPGSSHRQPAGLPARNRPDPPNPGPFGLDRSSLDGR